MESGSSPGRRGSWLLYHPREVLRKMFLNPVREAMVLEVKILLQQKMGYGRQKYGNFPNDG